MEPFVSHADFVSKVVMDGVSSFVLDLCVDLEHMGAHYFVLGDWMEDMTLKVGCCGGLVLMNHRPSEAGFDQKIGLLRKFV